MLYGHTREAMALIRRRIERYGIDCDVRDERILDHRLRFLLEHMDVHWQRLSRTDMAGRLATDRYSGGLVERDAFHFHPLEYADGLAAGGVAIREHSAVTKLARAGAAWRVETGEGAITARDVVVCCGGYLDKRLHPCLRSALCGDHDRLGHYRRWGLPWAGRKAGLAAAQLLYWYHGARDRLRC